MCVAALMVSAAHAPEHPAGKETAFAAFYLCNSRKQSCGPFCGTCVEAESLEAMAVEALRRAAELHRLAEWLLSDAEEQQTSATSPEETVRRLCDALASLDEKELQLNQLSRSKTDRATLEDEADKIRESRRQLNDSLASARLRLVGIVKPEEMAIRAEGAAQQLRNALPEAEKDPYQLKELLRSFMRIILHPDREPAVRLQLPAP